MSARLLLAATAALLGACFSPTYREGLTCTESGECPGDLKCIQQQCLTPGSDPADVPDSGIAPGADAEVAEPDASLCIAGSETIEATGAIVDFIVPACITSLTIEAFGAEGGGGVAAAVLGGKGARIKGDVVVAGGEVLQVLVGMRGADAVQLGGDAIGEQGGGTGGGGSFVVAEDGSPLIIAGGGGGATQNTFSSNLLRPGGDGSILSAGQSGDGSLSGVGGIDGAGGGVCANTGFHGGTGGGGFVSGGVGMSTGNSMFGTPNAPGSGFADGGAGGLAGTEGRNGGFGGGGSAGFTGGGGGGYSGGGAGGQPNDATRGGGGGGSLNSGINQDDSPGVRVGDGQVIITWTP